MKKLLTLALLLALLGGPKAAQATPTRLLTTDNMNQIVPDDWDATTYYSLSPLQNHWYADQYATYKSRAGLCGCGDRHPGGLVQQAFRRRGPLRRRHGF